MSEGGLRDVLTALPAVRETVAQRISTQPGEWMSIPAWSRWFRIGYRLRGRDLTDPHP